MSWITDDLRLSPHVLTGSAIARIFLFLRGRPHRLSVVPHDLSMRLAHDPITQRGEKHGQIQQRP